MVQTAAPNQSNKDRGSGSPRTTPQDQVLSETLQRVCEENPHLLEYIKRLQASGIGMPEYVPKLSRKMSEIKEPNLIYPTGAKGIFIHILYDDTGDMHNYITVEPTTTMDLSSLMEKIEDACIAISEHIPGIDPYAYRQ